jgi:hypothetical protein
MIAVLEIAGFFLVITAALRFSSWAEGWLTPSAPSIEKRAPNAASSDPGS